MSLPIVCWSGSRRLVRMRTHFCFAAPFVATLALAGAASGCKPRPTKPSSTTPLAQGSSGAISSPSAELSRPKHIPKDVADQLVFRVLVGPQLLIQPGKGLGPVRFGATKETIERLMESKPTEVVNTNALTVLRYQSHAVEFTLQDGAVVKMHVHGNEREYTPGKGKGVENVYGIFNGAFANGGKLGMYSEYAKQGEPKRTETVVPGRYPTVEKHFYDDMVLEYDKLDNGNIVLAGVVLTKPGWSENPAP